MELNIDFELIRKKVISELSESEERVFQDWLKQDVKHKQYFEKAQHYLKSGKVFNESDIDISPAWHAVDKSLKKPESQQKWIKLIGSIAASIVIVFSLYYMVELTNSKSSLANKSEQIGPGTNQAELVLSDGTVVKLGNTDDAIEERDGTIIYSDSVCLEYYSEGRNSKEHVYNEVRVGRGEEFQLVLADGTQIWLNSMSSIRFPIYFSGANREVEITGEVFFDVAHDELKPFIVHTPIHDIKVLGTSFNVSCYGNDNQVHTTLVTGKVEINNIKNKEDRVFVTPGQQFVYSKLNHHMEVREVNTDAYTGWVNGCFLFEEQRLEDIFNKLERWYEIDVLFDNNAVKEEVFTGKLPRFENMDTLLDMIASVSNVEFEIIEDKVIVK